MPQSLPHLVEVELRNHDAEDDDTEDEKNAEAIKLANKVEEVTLDLDDAIEIEE